MTLVEFLAPLKSGTHESRVLAVLYFCEQYEDEASLTTDVVKKRLVAARAPGASKVNVPDVLGKSGAFADTNGMQGKNRLWKLTESGRMHVRALLGLPANKPELEHDVATLAAAVSKVTDVDVREYLEEALKSLSVGALRPCVVSVWVAAVRSLQHEMMVKGTATVTAAVQKHDQKAKAVKSVDDFAYIKESIQLLAARELGVLDKSEKDTLEEALDLRNRCGHPSKYRPGVKKVSAFMEDVVSIIFI
jgi:hypothetical protein